MTAFALVHGESLVAAASWALTTAGAKLFDYSIPLEDVQALQPRDRVQVVGTVTAPGELVVCAQPEHRLLKIE